MGKLCDRYFRKTELGHFGDCSIYRACPPNDFAFCSCGLLHDMNSLDFELAKIIYPKYQRDWEIQWHQTDIDEESPEQKVKRGEDYEKNLKLLYEIFGTPTEEESKEERKERYKEWILKEFGDSFPNAIERLNLFFATFV